MLNEDYGNLVSENDIPLAQEGEGNDDIQIAHDALSINVYTIVSSRIARDNVMMVNPGLP